MTGFRKKLVLGASLLGIGVASPIAFSPARGITTNDAVCDPLNGTCCTEIGAICNAGGSDHDGYYYQATGPCVP